MIAEKKQELENDDPDMVPLMCSALDLIARLTDDEESAKEYCLIPEQIKEICDDLKECKSFPQVCDGMLRVIENLTDSLDNLEAVKTNGVPESIKDLVEDEVEDLLESLRRMAKIVGDLARDTELKEKFAVEKIPLWLKENLQQFAKDEQLQVNTAYANRNLVKGQYDPNIEQVLDSKVLPIAATFLKSHPDCLKAADYNCDVCIEATYRRPEFKKKLAALRIGPSIVQVLLHFGHPDNYDKGIIDKCMIVLSNLSYEAQNNLNLSLEGIIPAMLQALKSTKLDPKTAQMILGTNSNMAFEYDAVVLKKIVNDNCIQIYNDTLKEFDKTGNLPLFLMACDGLANIAHNKEIVKVISDFDLIDYLLRCLKGNQDNVTACYKVTRCLYRLCGDDAITQQIIDKNGHEIIVQTTDKMFNEGGTCLNCLKLLNRLAEIKDQVLFQEIFEAGIPNVVIQKYTLPDPEEEPAEVEAEGVEELPTDEEGLKKEFDEENKARHNPDEVAIKTGFGKPHVSESLKLMSKMNFHEESSHLIANNFAAEMFDTMNKMLEARDIQIPVQDLCRALLERDENIDPLYYAQGIPALKNVLERWDFEPNVAVKALESLLILLRRNPDYVQQAKDIGFKMLLKSTLDNIDPTQEPDITRLTKQCIHELKDDDDEEESDDDLLDEAPELTKQALNFMWSGKIITVINEEFKKKKLHFFLTRDMKSFCCKEPKKAKVLQDYAVAVKKIHDVFTQYEVNNESSFVKATGMFERKPAQELTFTIIGPVTRHGRKNLYMICDKPGENDLWVEYINMIRAKVDYETKMALKK